MDSLCSSGVCRDCTEQSNVNRNCFSMFDSLALGSPLSIATMEHSFCQFNDQRHKQHGIIQNIVNIEQQLQLVHMVRSMKGSKQAYRDTMDESVRKRSTTTKPVVVRKKKQRRVFREKPSSKVVKKSIVSSVANQSVNSGQFESDGEYRQSMERRAVDVRDNSGDDNSLDSSKDNDVSDDEVCEEKDNEGDMSSMAISYEPRDVRFMTMRDKERTLVNDNKNLRNRIIELERVAEGMRTNNSGLKYGGKNKVRKKDSLTMTDRLNATQINEYLKQKLFPYIKFLPNKWMKYSDKDRSLCARIMALVTVPIISDNQLYWKNILCPMINEKWCAVRANIKECIRIQYLCEDNMRF